MRRDGRAAGGAVVTIPQNRTEGPCEARSATEGPSGERGELVSVFVHGTPVPKGNLKRSRYGRTYFEAHVTAWCDTMATACKAAYRGAMGPTAPPHSGPVAVELAFSFDRPASHGAGRRRGVRVGKAAKTLPACTSHRLGDLDKLARNALDALTNGGVIVDDSHVVRLVAAKEYGGGAGVTVRVVAL
jgi:Holliday junction resolvase RusA-like endonuclease